MKTLTIREPYASLIKYGHKRYETRGYPTKYRGPIVIHASKKEWPEWKSNAALMEEMTIPEEFLFHGALVCIGDLVDCIEITPEFIATLSDSEKAFGFYSVGRYAWKIENVKPIWPYEMRGKLGLWECPDDKIKSVFPLD